MLEKVNTSFLLGKFSITVDILEDQMFYDFSLQYLLTPFLRSVEDITPHYIRNQLIKLILLKHLISK